MMLMYVSCVLKLMLLSLRPLKSGHLTNSEMHLCFAMHDKFTQQTDDWGKAAMSVAWCVGPTGIFEKHFLNFYLFHAVHSAIYAVVECVRLSVATRHCVKTAKYIVDILSLSECRPVTSLLIDDMTLCISPPPPYLNGTK